MSNEPDVPTGTLLETEVRIFDNYNSLKEKRYGREEDNALNLSPEEALHLAEHDELIVENNDTQLSADELYEHFTEQNTDFPQRYTVFKDLREKGYTPKSGFKYGTQFRVYDKGVDPYSSGSKTAREHTKWVVQAVPEQYTLNYEEMARAVRLAQNIRATMLWAVVDAENDVTYYEIKRITP